MKKFIMALALACFCLAGAANAEAHDGRKHSNDRRHHARPVIVKQYKYAPVVRYYKPAPYAYGHNRHYNPRYVRYNPPRHSYYYWFMR